MPRRTSSLSEFAIALICVFSTVDEAAGADNVAGRLRFSPPIIGPVTAFMNVYLLGIRSPARVINVNASSPYEFAAAVDEGEVGVELEFIVEAPSGYVPRVPRYQKKRNVLFREVVPIMRKADAYVLLRKQAFGQSDPSAGKRDFQYLATDLAESPGQKIEAFRTYAKWVDTLPKQDSSTAAAQQVKILESAYTSGAVSAVGERKRFVYWQERLDAFLNLVDFASLSQPEIDFGTKIASNPNDYKAWTAFVEQYKKENSGWKPAESPSTDAEAVSKDLKALRVELKHNR